MWCVRCPVLQAERRAAEQYAADLQKQIARETALAEAEGRIKCVHGLLLAFSTTCTCHI